MKPNESAGVVALLKAAYPRQELDRDTIRLYAKMLADLDAEVVVAAVERIIATSKWFPTVAEIRAETTRNPAAKTGAEAWGGVLEQIRLVGHTSVPIFQDARTASTIRELGGWYRLCCSDNPISERARFIERYEQLLAEDTRRRQLGAHGYHELVEHPASTLQIVGDKDPKRGN
jgi:hypothetical protein